MFFIKILNPIPYLSCAAELTGEMVIRVELTGGVGKKYQEIPESLLLWIVIICTASVPVCT